MAKGIVERSVPICNAVVLLQMVALTVSCSGALPSRQGDFVEPALAAGSQTSLAGSSTDRRILHPGKLGRRAATIAANGETHVEVGLRDAWVPDHRGSAHPPFRILSGRLLEDTISLPRFHGASANMRKLSHRMSKPNLSVQPSELDLVDDMKATGTFSNAEDIDSKGDHPTVSAVSRLPEHGLARHAIFTGAAHVALKSNSTLLYKQTLGVNMAEELEYELNMRYIETAPCNKLMLAAVEALGFGCCGIDRCLMGQPVLGIIKGVTIGGLLLWALIDYLLILANCFSFSTGIDVFGYAATFEESTVGPAFMLFATVLAIKVTLTAARLRALQVPRTQVSDKSAWQDCGE